MIKNYGHVSRMPMQASLPGFDAAPKPTDRLFFAIFPDTDAAARIAELARRLRGEHGLNGKLIDTARFHVTLLHLGDFAGLPQDIVTRAGEAAAAVAMPPFEITFDRAMSFLGRLGELPFVLRGGQGVHVPLCAVDIAPLTEAWPSCESTQRGSSRLVAKCQHRTRRPAECHDRIAELSSRDTPEQASGR